LLRTKFKILCARQDAALGKDFFDLFYEVVISTGRLRFDIADHFPGLSYQWFTHKERKSGLGSPVRKNGFVFFRGLIHLLKISFVCRQIENSKMGSFGNFLFLRRRDLRELRDCGFWHSLSFRARRA
jgi:hypothetical protein